MSNVSIKFKIVIELLLINSLLSHKINNDGFLVHLFFSINFTFWNSYCYLPSVAGPNGSINVV